MTDLTRREFVSAASTRIAATAGVFAIGHAAKAAPSERVRHAVIGVGGQGGQHAKNFSGFADTDVAAVCDLDPERLDRAASGLSGGGAVKQHKHFEEILADPDIDSVSVTTPDHWHTPIALLALQAGKHVYVEKPCSHTLEEGRVLLRAAEASGKCVQHGTQSRSGAGIQQAMQYMRDGHLGNIRVAKAINHQFRGPIGRAPATEAPAGVDYDRWLGSAPKHAFTKNRWHYNWHWFWDYGTGDMGNDGVHQMDVARWGLGVTSPQAVSAMGGQLFYDDDHETPDTQVVTFDFGGRYLIYEMRLWTDYTMEGHDNGVVFYGDKGTMGIGRNGCEVTLIGEEKKKLSGGADFKGNLRNFIDCVKADDPAQLNAPIKEGVQSAALCHLGNIGTRIGRGFRLTDGVITDDSEAKSLETKEYRAGYELARTV